MYTKSQEFMAEVVGTMVLILFGLGVVALVVLFDGNKGGYDNITWAWGLGVTFGIYISGKISGAHLNPAVTLGLAATGRFPWCKVGYYIVAQILGAFIAAGIVYAVFYTQMRVQAPVGDFPVGFTGIFATSPYVPNETFTSMSGFVDQFVGTALLMALILAVGDENNTPAGGMSPFVVGLIVVAIGMSFGGMHGYAINPARDFGPRLFTAVANFADSGFANGNFVVPIVATSLGGIFGAKFYDCTVGKVMKMKKI
ncbi:MAG: MIP family channel protein [Deferribacteraceae bacterium]|nr:MIP family channel protein [Deferribacteraceae bacterium]